MRVFFYLKNLISKAHFQYPKATWSKTELPSFYACKFQSWKRGMKENGN